MRSLLAVLLLAGCFNPQPGYHESNHSNAVRIEHPPPAADAGVFAAPAEVGPAPPDAGPPPLAHAEVSSMPASPPYTGPAVEPARVPAGKGCLKPNDPRPATLRADAARVTAANFAAALAGQGLHKGGIGTQFLELHRGIDHGGGQFSGHRTGTVVQATVNGTTGAFLAGNTEWSGNARHLPPWELVTDGNGDVWRLVRAPQPSAASSTVVMCGCAQRPCGPYGSGCPACGSTVQTMYGPLPPGATFRGDVVVAYEQVDVVVTQAQGICQPLRKCPPPPP